MHVSYGKSFDIRMMCTGATKVKPSRKRVISPDTISSPQPIGMCKLLELMHACYSIVLAIVSKTQESWKDKHFSEADASAYQWYVELKLYIVAWDVFMI